MCALGGDGAHVDVVIQAVLEEDRGDGLSDVVGGVPVEADPIAGGAASADAPGPCAGVHGGSLHFFVVRLERDAVGLGEHVLECKGGFHGVTSVAAVHEVAELGHLVQGVLHGDVIRQHGAGLGRFDDGLRVDHREVPIGRGQVVNAAVRRAEAESTKQGGRHVVGVAGAAGNLLAVEGQRQEFVGLQFGAGEGGHAKSSAGCRSRTRPYAAARKHGLVDGELYPPPYAKGLKHALGSLAAHVACGVHRKPVATVNGGNGHTWRVGAPQVQPLERALQGQPQTVKANGEVGDCGRSCYGDVLAGCHGAAWRCAGWG